MENKCIKNVTTNQLQALVEYMEENPKFARENIVIGSNKKSIEKEWIFLMNKLNSLGPPISTIVEWKKSWADFISRTKEKIAENNKIMRQTGGGLRRMINLSELEQIVDRILFLSKAAAPSGSVFGYLDANNSKPNDPIDNGFRTLIDTPSSSKAIAVIAPSRQQGNVRQQEQTLKQEPPAIGSLFGKEMSNTLPNIGKSAESVSTGRFFPRQRSKQNNQLQQHKQRNFNNRCDELPACSSAKRKKTTSEEISLIRRQLKVDEESAVIAKEQSNATKTLAEATQTLVAAVNKIADAAKAQAEAAKRITETHTQILLSIEAIKIELSHHFCKK